jgi:hypothetical protein
MESKELPDYQKLCQSFIPLPQFLCLLWLPSWIRQCQREDSNRSYLGGNEIGRAITLSVRQVYESPKSSDQNCRATLTGSLQRVVAALRTLAPLL